MINVYYYDNEGCGEWVLFYIVDIIDDGVEGYLEFIVGNMVFGGEELG